MDGRLREVSQGTRASTARLGVQARGSAATFRPCRKGRRNFSSAGDGRRGAVLATGLTVASRSWLRKATERCLATSILHRGKVPLVRRTCGGRGAAFLGRHQSGPKSELHGKAGGGPPGTQSACGAADRAMKRPLRRAAKPLTLRLRCSRGWRIAAGRPRAKRPVDFDFARARFSVPSYRRTRPPPAQYPSYAVAEDWELAVNI